MMLALLCAVSINAQRLEKNLKNWEFSRDGQTWTNVQIPHDWAISGPFDKKWDLQTVAIEQNGETQATEKSGRSGALPWIGEGHYRTQIEIPEGYLGAELVFDGAMAEPVVKVNGEVVGGWKYGYNAFRIDISRFIEGSDGEADAPGKKPASRRKNGKTRTDARSGQRLLDVEVDLQNLEESSRWYPGAGLYRPVRLILTGNNASKARIDDWSVFVQTVSADKDKALVNVSGRILNADKQQQAFVSIKDGKGKTVASESINIGAEGQFDADFEVRKPGLWSPETPYLYILDVDLLGKAARKGHIEARQMLDHTSLKFGIRTVSVSKERGFELNGVSRKIQGVCLHHDLGPLGAAVNKQALVRQVQILKEMGCDAIRTAHNMPSTMQMEVCDSMGMMVMAESFDMWIYPKCKNGYARFFKEWADKDITNLVLNHRNHPSIVMWSIGNEIPEQWSEEGRQISLHLQELIHRLDSTRPVTQGMDRADEALKSGFAQVMDVPGFNYRVHKYDRNITQLPKGFLLGSETASTVSSRGVYKFPVVVTSQGVYADGQCSSYDTEYCSWSNLPDDDFLMMDDRSYTIGQFVWTGFDYIGEPTPYDEYWPSRSSYFGICDLAGLPKDRYYLYRSQWNKRDHTLHILPHWNWSNREGETTPVYVYTDYPEAELFVNGKSQGRMKKDLSASQIVCNPDAKGSNEELLDRYRLRWNQVAYEPGELKVVAFDETGRKAAEMVKHTAGKPAQLVLTNAPIARESSDGKVHAGSLSPAGCGEMTFITVQMADADGYPVPDCNDELTFEVGGSGVFKAVCNGDATSLEPFTEPRMRLFNGQLVVVVQANEKPGTLTLTVKDSMRGLEKSVLLEVR